MNGYFSAKQHEVLHSEMRPAGRRDPIYRAADGRLVLVTCVGTKPPNFDDVHDYGEVGEFPVAFADEFTGSCWIGELEIPAPTMKLKVGP